MTWLPRHRPLRDRPVGRSKLADTSTCARCPRPATVANQWCTRCAEDVADQRVGSFVRRRDKCCVFCGKRRGPLQAAHILRRRYRRIRWEPKNIVAACPSCHLYLDTHKSFATAWFREHRPGLVAELDRLKDAAPPVDLAEILATYREAA